MDDKLLKHLLAADESELVDYKAEFYKVNDKESKISFAKDVLAMANTCVAGDAYILCGVSKNTKGEIQVVGVDENLYVDDAPWHDVMSKYSSHPVGFQIKKFKSPAFSCWLVAVQIYAEQRRPNFCTKDEGDKLQQGAIYYRNGSKNDVTKDLVTLERMIAESLQRTASAAKIETDPTYNRYLKLPQAPYYSFFGRKSEIEEVYIRLIDHHKNYVLSLVGDGGVGKTSVAYMVATEVQAAIQAGTSTFDDVVWISGKDQRIYLDQRHEIEREFASLDDLFVKILLIFHNPAYVKGMSPEQRLPHVKQALDGTKFFFVLDNLEVFSPEEIRKINEFMANAPSGHKFLITSRHDLRVHDLIEIRGMDLPTFRDYTQDIARRFEIQAADLADVSASLELLHRLTNGNPLYLKFFLAQVKKGRRVVDIVERRSTAGERNLTEYCFDTTLDQLGERELLAMYAMCSANTEAVALHELVYMTRLGEQELVALMDELASVSLIYSMYTAEGKKYRINPFLKRYLVEERRIPPAEFTKLLGRSRLYYSLLQKIDTPLRFNFFLGDRLTDCQTASYNLAFEILSGKANLDKAVINEKLRDATLLYPGNYLVPFIRYFEPIVGTNQSTSTLYRDLNRDFSLLAPSPANAPDVLGMYVWRSLLYICLGKYDDVHLDLASEAVVTSESYDIAEPLTACIRAVAYHFSAVESYRVGRMTEHDRLREQAELLFSHHVKHFMSQPYFYFLKRNIFRTYQQHYRHYHKEELPNLANFQPFLDDFLPFRGWIIRPRV